MSWLWRWGLCQLTRFIMHHGMRPILDFLNKMREKSGVPYFCLWSVLLPHLERSCEDARKRSHLPTNKMALIRKQTDSQHSLILKAEINCCRLLKLDSFVAFSFVRPGRLMHINKKSRAKNSWLMGLMTLNTPWLIHRVSCVCQIPVYA